MGKQAADFVKVFQPISEKDLIKRFSNCVFSAIGHIVVVRVEHLTGFSVNPWSNPNVPQRIDPGVVSGCILHFELRLDSAMYEGGLLQIQESVLESCLFQIRAVE
jgi:hypothetical protein